MIPSRHLLQVAARVAVALSLTASASLPAHETAALRPAEGSGARGEARIGDDEIRVRGDDLPPGVPITVWIAGEDGALAEAFSATTESNGSFDVRAREGDGLPFGAGAASDFAGRAVRVVGTIGGETVVLLEGGFPRAADDDELGVGITPLSPPGGAPFPDASGRVRTKASEGRHSIEVRVRGLADGAVFSVWVTDGEGSTEGLGSITTNGGGNGALKVDTRDGGMLPFGAAGVTELAGAAVEVKDAEGTVVLAGRVPALGEREERLEVEVEFDLALPDDAPEPAIRGDVKFESEPERDTVRVRLDRATPGAEYVARIHRPVPSGAEDEPVRETFAELTADEDGEAEVENRGRGVLPLGAETVADLAGAVVEVLRLEEDAMVLVLTGVVPAAPATPQDPPPPVAELEFVVRLEQPSEPVLPAAGGKVEFEEEDDEHEIEVEIEDLVPGAGYAVVIRGSDGGEETLFEGPADGSGDVRRKVVLFGSERLPLGVSSFRGLDGAVILVLDAGGATVLSGMIVLQSGSGAALETEISFAMVGEYDGVFVRGDSNRDFALDIADAIAALNYLFRDGAPPRCEDAMDANDDGAIDVSDAVFGLLYLFDRGREPAFPGARIAGFDRSADLLFCSDR